MESIYVELKENVWGIKQTDYENLPTNVNGVKIAKDMPDGTCLEIFDESSGKITKYAEAFKGAWYER